VIIEFKMIYFGVYCWKYVYGPLWYIIRIGSYIDFMVDTFVKYFSVCARAIIVRESKAHGMVATSQSYGGSIA
jgi:hypothetical protein